MIIVIIFNEGTRRASVSMSGTRMRVFYYFLNILCVANLFGKRFFQKFLTI